MWTTKYFKQVISTQRGLVQHLLEDNPPQEGITKEILTQERTLRALAEHSINNCTDIYSLFCGLVVFRTKWSQCRDVVLEGRTIELGEPLGAGKWDGEGVGRGRSVYKQPGTRVDKDRTTQKGRIPSM